MVLISFLLILGIFILLLRSKLIINALKNQPKFIMSQKGGFLKALGLPTLTTLALFKGTKKGKSLFNMKGGKRRRKSRTRKRRKSRKSAKVERAVKVVVANVEEV